MLNHALSLAAEGFDVFPCNGKDPYPILYPDGTKPPKGDGGYKLATREEQRIRQWWSQWPTANVGIAVPPGCVVIDVDPRNGGDPARLPELPDTLTAVTGRGDGGLHLWFQLPPDLRLPASLKAFGEGMDVKNGGSGYVMAPGSIHPDTGGEYLWAKRAPIMPAPSWLSAFAYPRMTAESVARDIDDSECTRSAEELQAVVEQVTPYYVEGKMHNIAKSLGGWLKQRGWTEADALSLVALLPSKNPQNAAEAVRAAYSIDKAFGWGELQNLLGEGVTATLEQVTSNPHRERTEAANAVMSDVLASLVSASPVLPPAPMPGVATRPGMLERMLALRNQGPPMPVGIAPLDARMRGGMRPQKVMVIGGAPGAGKTSLMRQIADYATESGVPVCWYAADEEPVGIHVRQLQARGFSRDVVENPTDDIIALIQNEYMNSTFEVYDVADGWTLEGAVIDFSARYPNRARLVCVDSLQTARTAKSSSLEKKAKLDNLVETIKHLSRAPATECAIIATSEIGRSSYISETNAALSNDMAAFKESGDVEYAGHVLLVVRSLAGVENTVEVSVPKNRLGSSKQSFLLEFNPDSTNFKETFTDPRVALREEATRDIADTVLQKIKQAPYPGISQSDLQVRCHFRRDALREALLLLESESKIAAFTGPKRVRLFRATDAQNTPPPENVDVGLAFATGGHVL